VQAREDERERELVPGKDEDERRSGCDPGKRKRERNVPKCEKGGTTIDFRGLL